MGEAIKRIEQGDYNIHIKQTSQDELGKLVGKFNNLVKSIREKEKEKNDFLMSASHQLRTPSSDIKFQLQLLIKEIKKSSNDKKIIEKLEEIKGNNERTIMIMDGLLKVLELGDKYFANNLKKIKIKEKIDEIIASFYNKIFIKKLQIQVDINPKLTIKAEELRIKTAFINLIENAICYIDDGGKIQIKAVPKGNSILFSINDNGIGIPKEERFKIFDKFFRSTNSYLKKSVGTGLGLVIVKNIIEGHGGKIWFESIEGKGTTFYFNIPTDIN